MASMDWCNRSRCDSRRRFWEDSSKRGPPGRRCKRPRHRRRSHTGRYRRSSTRDTCLTERRLRRSPRSGPPRRSAAPGSLADSGRRRIGARRCYNVAAPWSGNVRRSRKERSSGNRPDRNAARRGNHSPKRRCRFFPRYRELCRRIRHFRHFRHFHHLPPSRGRPHLPSSGLPPWRPIPSFLLTLPYPPYPPLLSHPPCRPFRPLLPCRELVRLPRCRWRPRNPGDRDRDKPKGREPQRGPRQ